MCRSLVIVIAALALFGTAEAQERLVLETRSHEMERNFSREGVGLAVGAAVAVSAGLETRLDLERGSTRGGHLEAWLQGEAGVWYEKWAEVRASSRLATPVVVGSVIESGPGSNALPVRGAHVIEGSVYAMDEGGVLIRARADLVHEGNGPRPGQPVNLPTVPYVDAGVLASGVLRVAPGGEGLSFSVLPELTGGIRYLGFTDPTALLGSRVETRYSIRYPGLILRIPGVELDAYLGAWDMRWYDYEHGVVAERMQSDIGFLDAEGRFWIHGVLLTASSRVGFSFIDETDSLPFSGELRLGVSMDGWEVGLATAQENLWSAEGHRWIRDWRSELLVGLRPASWRTGYALRLFYSELESLTRGSSERRIDRFGAQLLADAELFTGGHLGLSLRSHRGVLDTVNRWDPWRGALRWTHELGLYLRWEILETRRALP